MNEPLLAKVPWSVGRDQFPRSGLILPTDYYSTFEISLACRSKTIPNLERG